MAGARPDGRRASGSRLGRAAAAPTETSTLALVGHSSTNSSLGGPECTLFPQGAQTAVSIGGCRPRCRRGTTTALPATPRATGPYSHSIVAVGFDETSSATRFTPDASSMIPLET